MTNEREETRGHDILKMMTEYGAMGFCVFDFWISIVVSIRFSRCLRRNDLLTCLLGLTSCFHPHT